MGSRAQGDNEAATSYRGARARAHTHANTHVCVSCECACACTCTCTCTCTMHMGGPEIHVRAWGACACTCTCTCHMCMHPFAAPSTTHVPPLSHVSLHVIHVHVHSCSCHMCMHPRLSHVHVHDMHMSCACACVYAAVRPISHEPCRAPIPLPPPPPFPPHCRRRTCCTTSCSVGGRSGRRSICMVERSSSARSSWS